jgi:RNA polymerase sigma factor (sigma-70 family)
VASDVGLLVGRAADGEERAWEELVERFGGLVWATARSVGLSNTAASDVSQTTWLRLAEHLNRLREPDRVGSWLTTTARHEAIRVARLASRDVLTDPWGELDSVDTDWGPLETIEEQEMLQAVHAALAHLPTRCRTLLTALAGEGPSYAEISERLGIPVGSIGPTRARCLERLRALLASAEQPMSGRVGASRGSVES